MGIVEANNSTSGSGNMKFLVAVLAISALGKASVKAQDCLDPRWTEGDEVEENLQRAATQCDTLIDEGRIEVDEGDDVTIECNTGISNRVMRVVSECRWITPEGAECIWRLDDDDGSDNPFSKQGDYCGGDSSVQFRGNFMQSSCDIVIVEAEDRHDGLWKCVAAAGEEFVDNVDIKLNTGMETSTILAITIPIGILVILIIILILICLLCPAWFAVCRRKKNNQDQAKNRDLPAPMMAPPPQPMANHPQPYRPYAATGEDGVYEVTSSEATEMSRMPLRTHTPAAMPLPASVASSSSSPTVYDNVDNQYDQVSYMQPRPSVPEPPQYAPQTRTAKKISNISSINFLNSTRNKKKDSYA